MAILSICDILLLVEKKKKKVPPRGFCRKFDELRIVQATGVFNLMDCK